MRETIRGNRMKARWGLFVITILFLVLSFSAPAQGQHRPEGSSPNNHRYYETIPVYHVEKPVLTLSEQYVQSGTAVSQASGSPTNPYASLYLDAPTFMQPGSIATYEITLANFESITHTYTLTNALPPHLQYIPGTASDGLTYDPATRTFTWQGELEPAQLEYVITDNTASLPYLDLADFGAANLCDDFIAAGGGCDDVMVTFNLGINNYRANLYGEEMAEVTITSNGLALVSNAPSNSPTNPNNQWLPDSTPPGHLLAGLWRDGDLGGGDTADGGADTTNGGRWHAAIISGWIDGHDVFYAQWHNAPHKQDPDLTVRHAIAIILNGDSSHVGHAYYIYDNVSNPAQAINLGYTIGLEDKLGTRGVTWAYAPCCGDPNPPQGVPPTPGTTLHLQPVLLGAGNNYTRTFTYQVKVAGVVPEMIANTVYAASDSSDPALSYMWDTHYLFARLQYYLPLITWSGTP